MGRLSLVILAISASLQLPLQAQSVETTAQRLESLVDLESAQLRASQAWSERTQFPIAIEAATAGSVRVFDVDGIHPIFLTTHNRLAGIVTGTRSLFPGEKLGLELVGRRHTIGIWDAGPVYQDHEELSGRIELGDVGGPSNHATHVAGTLAARGLRAAAQGMAPGGLVHSFNWNFHASEMHVEARDGLLLSNHSYGRVAGWHYLTIGSDSTNWYWFGDPSVSTIEDYAFGFYDKEAELFDLVAFSHPYYLPVVSAGNERDDVGPESGPYMALNEDGRWQRFDLEDRPIEKDGGEHGFDTISSIALAKNVLTVGSVGSRLAEPHLDLSDFSSAGPSDDGRIKPDIMGVGENILSTIATGTDHYASYTGTSMAAPNVTGSLLLLQELSFAQRGKYLRAATLKGLVLHHAKDLGNEGPDYYYGWGLLDTERSAKHLLHNLPTPGLLIEDSLASGTTFTRDLEVYTPGELRVTLSWTDPPGQRIERGDNSLLDNPIPQLQHDLDLRVVAKATGDTLYPYVLNRLRPTEAAVSGDNDTDPIEQVYAVSAPPGGYTLVVTHKGVFSNEMAQHFSLIVTGAEDRLLPVAIDHIAASPMADGVVLEWLTARERKQGRFVVERAAYADDALSEPLSLSFQIIGSVRGSGDSSRPTPYSHADDNTIEGTYRYRLIFESEAPFERTVVAETDIYVPSPRTLAVISNYPNPFTEETKLVLDLPRGLRVSLKIFDMLGRQVKHVLDEDLPAGRHRLSVSAANWAAGVYYAQLTLPDRVLLHKLTVVH